MKKNKYSKNSNLLNNLFALKTKTKIFKLPILNAFISPTFMKYVLVGGFVTLIDWGIFFLITHQLHFSVPITLAISMFCGSSSNFVLNKWLTFKNRSSKLIRQVLLHATFAITSYFLSLTLLSALMNILNVQAVAARVITTGCMVFVNFGMSKYGTFRIQ